MKLQVIVDSTMQFIDVHVGLPGCLTAEKVLPLSEFYNLAQNGERLNGNEMDLSQGTTVREYVVGGSGFQLLPWLITPYCEEQPTEEQNEFNDIHLATRMVAKRALKRLKEVWSVIDGGMWQLDRNQLPYIVLACCILHNIQIAKEGDGVSDVSSMLFDHDPGYPPEKSAFADENAEIARDNLRLYLARKDIA
uniref:protein ALP1-like n=1 Tax=Erigeron canadensis TaxID=72917 RepID=UPI001CB97898|nr:protein ALP1-like [Erigeron canadensis]